MPALRPIRWGSSPERTPKRPLIAGRSSGATPPTPNMWNSADKTVGFTLSNSDTTATSVNIGGGIRAVNSHATGKWYGELTVNTMSGNIFQNDGIGICISTTPLSSLFENATALFIRNNGWFYVGGVFQGALNTPQGQIIGIAYDGDLDLLWVRSENTANIWMGTGVGADPATGAFGFDVSAVFGGNAVFFFMAGDGGTTDIVTINQTPTYTPPAGFNFSL